jgi:hypothetical protein
MKMKIEHEENENKNNSEKNNEKNKTKKLDQLRWKKYIKLLKLSIQP